MSAEKAELSRAGTMQVTAKDGKGFLDKNLTDWKKPHLMEHFDGEEEEEEDSPTPPPAPAKGKKGKMAKHTTMKGTAKEANALLDDAGRPDEDALTRGQQKQIEDINAEKAPAKKAKLSKATTMVNTAKEGKALIGSEKLSDTRQETKKRKGAPKRESTISKTMAEAKAVFGDLPASEGRSLRKRPAPAPAPLKKAGTMQKTAKEGKAFLKRGPKAKKAKKEAPVYKEVEEDEDESA